MQSNRGCVYAVCTSAEKFCTYSVLRVRACCDAWVWNVECFHRCEEFLMDLCTHNLSLVGVCGSPGRS